jgi:hypothetical protein
MIGAIELRPTAKRVQWIISFRCRHITGAAAMTFGFSCFGFFGRVFALWP